MELTLVPDKRCGAYDADDVGLCNPKVSLSGFVVTCLVLPVFELDETSSLDAQRRLHRHSAVVTTSS